MTQRVEELMTPNPTTIPASATLAAASRAMRDHDVGDVVVLQESKPYGIVTDRDVVVRAIASGMDPSSTIVGEICSRELQTVSRKEPVEKALTLMREKALRRIPVVDKETVIGVISIGDLATARDPQSVLAQINGAIPNR